MAVVGYGPAMVVDLVAVLLVLGCSLVVRFRLVFEVVIDGRMWLTMVTWSHQLVSVVDICLHATSTEWFYRVRGLGRGLELLQYDLSYYDAFKYRHLYQQPSS